SAETPITADGCHTMKPGCSLSPADWKYAFQSRPGALASKSARFHGLFCLKTSVASESGANAWAIRVSNDRTRAALFSGSVTPTDFSTTLMCARYCLRNSALLGDES